MSNKYCSSTGINDVDGNIVTTSTLGSHTGLDVAIVNAPVEITVSAFTDSVAIADIDNNKVTTTDVSGKRSLDVNVTDITISHTNDSIKTYPHLDVDSTLYPTNASSIAYEASRVVKASPGVLYSVIGLSSSINAQFIQLHNTSSLPANGAVPLMVFKVEAGSNFNLSSESFAMYFPVGILICNSTTGPVLTLGESNCFFTVQYK